MDSEVQGKLLNSQKDNNQHFRLNYQTVGRYTLWRFFCYVKIDWNQIMVKTVFLLYNIYYKVK